jgi:hypothetical protein
MHHGDKPYNDIKENTIKKFHICNLNLHLNDNQIVTLNPISTQFSHKNRNKPEKPKNRKTGNPIQCIHATGTTATV